MPLSAPGARPAVATTAQELSAREAGACSSGRQERGCCQVGTTRLGSPGAGGGWMARGLSGRRGDAHPRRRREGTPIPGGRWPPVDYSRRGRGGRALPWSPTAGRGSRDRETRGPRVEAGSPCPWAPARLGACREAACEGSGAAGSSSEGAPGACGRRGWVEVPRAEWAERPGLGAVVPGRRAAVVLPRGPGSSSRS